MTRVKKYKSLQKMKWIPMLDKFSMRYIPASNATFLQCKFDKGCIVPQHIHDCNEEILHVIKGKLICFIGKNRKKYIVNAGETIVIPPKNLHGWRALQATIIYEVFSPPRSKAQMNALANKMKKGKTKLVS